LQEQKKKLENDFQAEVKMMGQKIDPLTEELEKTLIMTNRTNIAVKLVALVWSPVN